MTDREQQLLFALQSAWPYVHGFCTIQAVRNEVSRALFGRNDSGGRFLQANPVNAQEARAMVARGKEWLEAHGRSMDERLSDPRMKEEMDALKARLKSDPEYRADFLKGMK